jgi:hypothetical protein
MLVLYVGIHTQGYMVPQPQYEFVIIIVTIIVISIMIFISTFYLGTRIISYGTLQSEVKQQTHTAARISGYLNGTIWLCTYLVLETEVRT